MFEPLLAEGLPVGGLESVAGGDTLAPPVFVLPVLLAVASGAGSCSAFDAGFLHMVSISAAACAGQAAGGRLGG